jgi:hypothetical protein
MDRPHGEPAAPPGAGARVVFRESQRAREPWVLVVVGGVALAFLGGLAGAIATGTFRPAALLVVVPFGVMLPVLVLAMHLVTEVRADGIYVRFTPFHLAFRRFAFADLASVHLRRYSPIREYGGWGLRRGPSGWAYNLTGDVGLQLVSKDGERLLVGTRQPEALWAAILRVAPRAPGAPPA